MKKYRGSNIICSLMLGLLRRISSGEEEKGDCKFGNKIKI